MTTLMARGLSSELVTRVRQHARARGLNVSAAIAELLSYALDQREARQAGAVAANQGRSSRERRDAATRAIEARWYPLRATLLALPASHPDDLTPSARWMIDAIPQADAHRLSADDLARIDAYTGPATDLHELLATVLPLRRSIWYETRTIAQQGTEILQGYLAVGTSTGIEVGYAAMAPARDRLIGPLGPVHVTTTEMHRPANLNDSAWRELRSATGIIVRALLLNLR